MRCCELSDPVPTFLTESLTHLFLCCRSQMPSKWQALLECAWQPWASLESCVPETRNRSNELNDYPALRALLLLEGLKFDS